MSFYYPLREKRRAHDSISIATNSKKILRASTFVACRFDNLGEINVSLSKDATLKKKLVGFVASKDSVDSSNFCQLPSNRKRLQAILESIPSAIVVMEKPDGIITYANKRAIELHGINPCGLKIDEHTSKLKISTLAGKLFSPEELYTYKALFQGETTRNAQAVIKRPDGKLFCCKYKCKTTNR